MKRNQEEQSPFDWIMSQEIAPMLRGLQAASCFRTTSEDVFLRYILMLGADIFERYVLPIQADNAEEVIKANLAKRVYEKIILFPLENIQKAAKWPTA